MAKKQEDNRDIFDKALDDVFPLAGAYLGARVMGRGLKKAWKKTGSALNEKDARWNSLTEKQRENVRNFKPSGDAKYDAASAAETAADRQVTRRFMRGTAGAVAGGAAGSAASHNYESRKKRK